MRERFAVLKLQAVIVGQSVVRGEGEAGIVIDAKPGPQNGGALLAEGIGEADTRREVLVLVRPNGLLQINYGMSPRIVELGDLCWRGRTQLPSNAKGQCQPGRD